MLFSLLETLFTVIEPTVEVTSTLPAPTPCIFNALDIADVFEVEIELLFEVLLEALVDTALVPT